MENDIKKEMKKQEGKGGKEEEKKNGAIKNTLITLCFSLKSFINDTKSKEIIKALPKKYQKKNADQLEALLLQIYNENSEN